MRQFSKFPEDRKRVTEVHYVYGGREEQGQYALPQYHPLFPVMLIFFAQYAHPTQQTPPCPTVFMYTPLI